MKIRAFVIIAALATPVLANADEPQPPTDKPTASDKTTGDKSPSDKTMGDKSTGDKTTGTDKTGNKGAKLSDADNKILAHVHHVNQMEIDLGKVALKSSSAQVKSYAQTIINDHQSADKDLMAMARNHKLAAIPAEKPENDADRQDQKDMAMQATKLKSLKGSELDKEYLNMMVSGHEKELAKIDTSISSASDPDLQSFLKSLKPVLQRHADQARDLQKSPQAAAEPRDPNKPVDRLPSSKP